MDARASLLPRDCARATRTKLPKAKSWSKRSAARAAMVLPTANLPRRSAKKKIWFPNLKDIAAKVGPQWIYHWIKNPRGFAPDTRMPSLRLIRRRGVGDHDVLDDARRQGGAYGGDRRKTRRCQQHQTRRIAGAQVGLLRLPRYQGHGKRVPHRRRADHFRLEDSRRAFFRQPHRYQGNLG